MQSQTPYFRAAPFGERTPVLNSATAPARNSMEGPPEALGLGAAFSSPSQNYQ